MSLLLWTNLKDKVVKSVKRDSTIKKVKQKDLYYNNINKILIKCLVKIVKSVPKRIIKIESNKKINLMKGKDQI